MTTPDDDIVERLRKFPPAMDWGDCVELMDEAADTIARLRKELEQARAIVASILPLQPWPLSCVQCGKPIADGHITLTLTGPMHADCCRDDERIQCQWTSP